MPAACTSTSNMPSPGPGVSASTNLRTSGPPKLGASMYFMLLFSYSGHHWEGPRSRLGLRRESGCVAAGEFCGGNWCTADQLLEGVGHAVVTVLAMQLAHGDQVCDQMVRQPSIPE